MANLEQTEDSLAYYQGWYGTLSENGIDGCEPLKLVLGDGPYTKAYTEILNVIEIRDDNKAPISYNGILPDVLLGNATIKELKCGHSYLIVLKKGTGSVDIPEFTFATAGTSSYEYKIRSTI